MHQRTIITKRLKTTQDAVEAGRELIVMKQQLGHGKFLNYLSSVGMGWGWIPLSGAFRFPAA